MLNLPKVKAESDQGRRCGQHPNKPVDILCKDCQELSCSLCGMFGKHKGHYCVEITEAAREFKEVLKSKMAPINHAEEKVSNLMKYKQDYLVASRKKFSHCLDDVDKRAAKLLSQVNTYHNELRYEIQMKQQEYEERIYEVAKLADSYHETLKNYKQICEKQDEDIVEIYTKQKLQVDELLQNVKELSIGDLSVQVEWKFNDEISKIQALFEEIIINTLTTMSFKAKLSDDERKSGTTSLAASARPAVRSEEGEKREFKHDIVSDRRNLEKIPLPITSGVGYPSHIVFSTAEGAVDEV